MDNFNEDALHQISTYLKDNNLNINYFDEDDQAILFEHVFNIDRFKNYTDPNECYKYINYDAESMYRIVHVTHFNEYKHNGTLHHYFNIYWYHLGVKLIVNEWDTTKKQLVKW